MKQKESDNHETKHWLVGKLREWRKTKERQHFAYWISQKCKKQDDQMKKIILMAKIQPDKVYRRGQSFQSTTRNGQS